MSLLITDHFDNDHDNHGDFHEGNDHYHELSQVSFLGVDVFDEFEDHDDF